MAVGDADGSVEQAEVVVDLGDGAHGRARAAAGGLLLDGNGGAQALDRVYVRPLHLVEELAGVGGERLNVAALPLGMADVKSEAGLGGAAEPRHHGQRVPRKLDVNVLQ